jgi:hypothetical protein
MRNGLNRYKIKFNWIKSIEKELSVHLIIIKLSKIILKSIKDPNISSIIVLIVKNNFFNNKFKLNNLKWIKIKFLILHSLELIQFKLNKP